MKATDKPEISKKWWTKEKPDDVKGAELEKALAACEKALGDAKKNKDAKTIDAAIAALDDVDEAAKLTVKECEKKRLKDVVTVLAKFDKLTDGERAVLEKLQDDLPDQDSDGDEESDEDAKGVLKEEYRDRMIKLLRGGQQVQFCLGLNKQTPADSFLLLCNKRKPERLRKILKQSGDFSNRLMTFGTALADGKILNLTLADNAKEPAQITKTTKEYLKSHRDLKFRKIRVHVGGQVFEEEDNEDQNAAVAGGGDLQDRLRKAGLADAAWQKVRGTIADQIAQVQRELNAFESDADAKSVREGLGGLISKIPDPGFSDLAKSGDDNTFKSNLEKTRQRVRELLQMSGNGGAFQAIDQNPFGVNTNVVDTVNKTIAAISKDLSLT